MLLSSFLAETDLGLLLDFWLSVRPPGGIPERRRVDPTLLPPQILPWLMIFEADGPNRGTCRLAGSRIAAFIGAEATRRRMRDMVSGEVAGLWEPTTDLCVASRLPVRAWGHVGIAGRDWVRMRCLITPFAAPDGTTHTVTMLAAEPGNPVPGPLVSFTGCTEEELAAYKARKAFQP